MKESSLDPIAVVGLACRFPGSENAEAYWKLLEQGREATRGAPPERMAARSFLHSPLHPPHTSLGGFLNRVDRFDAPFFGIPPSEANRMDPQQRLVLEVAWEALEDAGVKPSHIAGSPGGVFLGISTHDYEKLPGAGEEHDVHAAAGGAAGIAANRVSYLLDWRGPSLAVDTGCSSSLVAVHLACQSLLRGESTTALAGGVNLILSTEASLPFARAGLLSPDGRCKAFDASANGYVRGEGCGMVVLKRLADALRDGDPVRALLLGSATGQDGRASGLTAPNGKARIEVLRSALHAGGVHPSRVDYVEADGTGTADSDAVEMNALKAVLLPGRAPDRICAAGAVKTNIGHLGAASGIAGLLKVVLSLEHGKIPANLHYRDPNPRCSLEGTPLGIPTSTRLWPVGDAPRVAAVSSFGLGGTLAHAVLQEAPPAEVSGPHRPWQLLTLSAKTAAALDQMSCRLAHRLRSEPDLALADVAYTHQMGRNAFAERRMLVCRNSAEAAAELSRRDSTRICLNRARAPKARMVFLFPAEGTEYLGMAAELYRQLEPFRQHMDCCAAIVSRRFSFDLRVSLEMTEPRVSQPALFAVEYALARLWMQYGVHPKALMGAGIGECVAACVAGVFDLEDALALAAARGELMQALLPGPLPAVDLQAALSRFRIALSGLSPNEPKLPFVSNFSGEWIAPGQMRDPEYWVRHLLEPVPFAHGLRTLCKWAATSPVNLLEAGPGSTLARETRYFANAKGGLAWTAHPSLASSGGGSDLAAFLTTLGHLWLEDHSIDWEAVHAGQNPRRLHLPTYPFQRQRYWIQEGEPEGPTSANAA